MLFVLMRIVIALLRLDLMMCLERREGAQERRAKEGSLPLSLSLPLHKPAGIVRADRSEVGRRRERRRKDSSRSHLLR